MRYRPMGKNGFTLASNALHGIGHDTAKVAGAPHRIVTGVKKCCFHDYVRQRKEWVVADDMTKPKVRSDFYSKKN